MSKSNPRKAMAALLPVPIKVGRGLTVEPMTLGMFAALERIGSPMVSKREPKDLVELIPSLYLLTHGAKEIFRPDFFDAAFAWADTVPTNVVERIRTACFRQLNAVFAVIPEDEPKKKNARKRRLDRRARPLGRVQLRLEPRGNPPRGAARGDLPPQTPGRAEEKPDLPTL